MALDARLTIIGNIVEDPELKYTTNGTAVCSLRVVHNERIYRNGNWEDGPALFLTCNVWRDMAENAAQSLHKGDRVSVTGKLKQRSYENREGQKRTIFEVEAEDVSASLLFATATINKRHSGNNNDWNKQDNSNNSPNDTWNSTPTATAFPQADNPPF